MGNFFEKFSIDNIFPAEYNPRKITKEEFEKLKESLTLFGVCKPVITNASRIITAEHQRTRSMKELNFRYCPIFVLNKKVAVHNEIRFNIMHNSIETETSECNILYADKLNFGFNEMTSDKIRCAKKGSGAITKGICKLINKHGNFDSVIINSLREIIYSSDHAYSCKILNQNMIVYKMQDEKIKMFF